MKSALQHMFSLVPQNRNPRSAFRRDNTLKTTIKADYLYPIYLDRIIPGDTHSIKMHNFIRMSSPLKVAPMDNLHFETFWFYIPDRVVWINHQKMMGEQDNPGDSIDYTIPKLDTYTGGVMDQETRPHHFDEGSLYDYFGLPTKVDFLHASAADNILSALPMRMYNLIVKHWFRDQNLEPSPYINTGNGPDPMYWIGPESGVEEDTYKLQKRCKKHDYFTSCAITPQKGTAATIGMSGEAPVYGTGKAAFMQFFSPGSVLTTGQMRVSQDASDAVYQLGLSVGKGNYIGATRNVETALDGSVLGFANKTQVGANPSDSGLYADMSAATMITINQLRLAATTQQFLEQKMRTGSRYKEIIRSFYGVSIPDGRIMWPELLGMTTQKILINPVAQSAPAAEGQTPLAQIAAHGTSANSEYVFNRSFMEWGYVIGLANVRADLTYWQGLDRHWTESSLYDLWWPQFANIGEQPVLKRELYFKGDDAYDLAVFGYQENGSWHRYKGNKITGEFRTNHSTQLDIYHLAQELTEPALNTAFIKSAVPMERVSAVTTHDYFLCDFYFEQTSIREMPVNSIPGISRL